MSSWPHGKATVSRLLEEGSLEIVTANTNFAKRLCDDYFRIECQYPSELTPSISIEDATYCYETSVNILKVVNEILDSGHLGIFSASQFNTFSLFVRWA